MGEKDLTLFKGLPASLRLAGSFIKKDYLSELSSREVVPLSAKLQQLGFRDYVRLLKLTRIVYDRRENIQDKLSNLYNALFNIGSSLVLILNSDGNYVDIYLGTKQGQSSRTAAAQNALTKSLTGNFPGSEYENLLNNQVEELMERITTSSLATSEKVIASVCGIPSLKNPDKEKFVQGVEKLIDAMKGEEFSAIFISDPITQTQLDTIRAGYEELYSRLSPLCESQYSFGISESESTAKGITEGFTESISQSISKTQNYTTGQSATEGYGESETLSGGISFFASLSKSLGSSKNSSYSQNESYSEGTGETSGRTGSSSKQESSTETKTLGNSKSLQVKFENRTVKGLLERIQDQLKRLKNSEDFGMWNCACYFLAEDLQTVKAAASSFKALMRGDNSAVENSYINIWDNENRDKLIEVKKYLKKFYHPIIDFNPEKSTALPSVTPTSLISGRELTIQFGLPLKSVPGLPVIETVEFGRDVITYDKLSNEKTIEIGNIFHMGRRENSSLSIDIDSLTMHTFITGSTGSGKSNAVYTILYELMKKNITFLVVEPAKGEYKSVLGGQYGVNVFGTNPFYTNLLKINPFKFPENIHVLEHIDRLIEIFNACWPMYSAMPAILKEAVEKTYEKTGWDLDNSINFNPSKAFPSFRDLLEVLPMIIEKSAYSEEVKSNYIGALVTRVSSLTNGLVGRIFCGREIDEEVLFNENCIVDLSRIGSLETKSLIMGIVFMRLQEYRYSSSSTANSSLRHVTVLEEAHNLLRRTSFEQSQEGSNLQGKSVEMISNAIAEMRTYGEGFIIADQAPGMLDPSVIRNTNTKIILRLPDSKDRELVGMAAGLNELQISELSRLRTGVAAIYQNNWLQPVLCSINEFQFAEPFIFEPEYEDDFENQKRVRGDIIKLLLKNQVGEEHRVDFKHAHIEEFLRFLTGVSMESSLRKLLTLDLEEFEETGNMRLWEEENFDLLSRVVSGIVDDRRFLEYSSSSSSLKDWNERFKETMRNYIELDKNEAYENSLIRCFLYSDYLRDYSFKEFYDSWQENNARELKGHGIS